MNHIPNCDVESGLDSYFVKNEEYQCLNCLGDHVWNATSQACEPCDIYIEGCDKCRKNTHGDAECLVCKNPE